MKTYNHSWAIGKGYSRLTDRKAGYTEGVVVTPHGMVWAYAQGDEHWNHITRLDFSIDGRVHARTIEKKLTHRGIATKARQFAAEMVENSRLSRTK